MFYAQQEDNGNTRTLTETWLGYNRNYRVQDGEFADMMNLSSDLFPLMSPRSVRASLIEGKNIRGLLISNNNLTYLDGATLHYGTRTYDLSAWIDAEDTTQEQLIRFGAYVLLVPAMVYVNVVQDVANADMGPVKAEFDAADNTTVTYSLSDRNGAGMDAAVSETPPDNPTNGQHWLKTKKDEEGLYIWQSSQGAWSPVASSYVKVTVPGAKLTDMFSVGDAVCMNTKLSGINNGSIIQTMGEDYFVVIGFPKEVSTTETVGPAWRLKIERKVPKLDYVCVCNNRLWGCFYGMGDGGEMVNEIFACKQGDLKNWNSFGGISTDSYYISVSDDGAWTGCIAYGGYPTFFKENRIYRIYGTRPAEYQMSAKNGRGVQQGSYRSLAVVNEVLMYKSASGVCVYDGSSPVSVSSVFARDQVYYDAVAGASASKYYITMKTAKEVPYQFVYDTEHGIWEREDAIGAEWFTGTESGQLYATDGKMIYGLGSSENAAYISKLVGEDHVNWWAETGDLQLGTPEYKKLIRLKIRAYIPFKSELVVSIKYDDGNFEELATIRATGKLDSFTVPVFGNYECDHYRLRFSGHGDVRVYSLQTDFESVEMERGR